MQNISRAELPVKRYVAQISNVLIGFAALGFILLFLTLSYFNRPANEDIVFVAIVRKQGFFEFVHWFYTGWCGRWMSSSLYYVILSASSTFQHIHSVYFLYYSVTIIVFIYAVSTIIQKGCHRFLHAVIDTRTSIVYSVLFIAGFYFSAFQNIEVWWWIFSSVDTLQGIILLLLICALLLKNKKSNLHFLIICFCALYLGGSFEVYAIIIGAVVLLLFAYLLLTKTIRLVDFINNYFLKRFAVAFILFAIATAISGISPGNFKRREKYVGDHITLQTGSYQNTEFPITLHDFVQKKYLVALLIAGLWLLLGMKLKSAKENLELSKQLRKALLFSFGLIMLSIIITYCFQILFLSYYTIPLRGWTFTSFSLFVFFCTLFFCTGVKLKTMNVILKNALLILLPTVVTAFMFGYFFKQYQYTSRYAEAYDKLITHLIVEGKNKETKVLYVQPLPESGMLLPLEIGTEYIDGSVKEIFNLNFNMVRKK